MELDPLLRELQNDKLLPNCQSSETLADEVFVLPEFHLDNLDSLALSSDVMALASEVLPSGNMQISSLNLDSSAIENSAKSLKEGSNFFPLEDSLNPELDLDGYNLLKDKVQFQEHIDADEKAFELREEDDSMKNGASLISIDDEVDEIDGKIGKKLATKKKSASGVMTVFAISRSRQPNITQIVFNTGNKEGVYDGKTLEFVHAKRNLPKLSKADNCQSNKHEMIITNALEDLGIREENFKCSEQGKVWLCPREDCNRKFTKLYALKGHLLWHFGIRPFKVSHASQKSMLNKK